MESDSLNTALEEEGGGLPPDFDADALDRILTEPQQDALAEAILADAVDAAPLAGDVLAITRMERADEQGIEYPERPAAVENVIADLPPPLDTVGDVIVSQNVLGYLEREYGASFPSEQEALIASNALLVDSLVDAVLPDGEERG